MRWLLAAILVASGACAPAQKKEERPSAVAAPPSAQASVDTPSPPPAAPASESPPEQLPAGPHGTQWLAKIMSGVVLGKTTVAELRKKLGEPEASWDHREGTTWYLYPAAWVSSDRPTGRRRFIAKNLVVVGIDLEDEGASREAIMAVLADLHPRPLTKGADGVVVCGLPGRRDLGIVVVFANGKLMEAGIAPWDAWTLPDNPCKTP